MVRYDQKTSFRRPSWVGEFCEDFGINSSEISRRAIMEEIYRRMDTGQISIHALEHINAEKIKEFADWRRRYERTKAKILELEQQREKMGEISDPMMEKSEITLAGSKLLTPRELRNRLQKLPEDTIPDLFSQVETLDTLDPETEAYDEALEKFYNVIETMSKGAITWSNLNANDGVAQGVIRQRGKEMTA